MVSYDVLVGLHVVSAVAGFGAVAVDGVYGSIAWRAVSEREDAGDDADVRRFFSRPSRAGHLVVVAPLFGIAAMAVRPGGREFGQIWALAGLAIWVAASVLWLAVARPATQAMRQGVMREAARRLAWSGAASDVLFVVALMLMVTQPR